MSGMKLRLGRAARLFLSSALAAYLGSGIASATCFPTLPLSAGSVPCYIQVQPIDVGTIPPGSTTPIFAPFNTTSPTGNPNFAGIDSMGGFNNSASANPIGFVVNPATGLFPGQSGYDPTQGVDVTRALLRNIGVDLVWLPVREYLFGTCPPPTPGSPICVQAASDFTTLSVAPAPTGSPIAANCAGYISGTTLTITTACSSPGTTTSAPLAVYDVLSCPNCTPGTFTPGTFISAFGTGSGGKGTYTVNASQTVGSSKKLATFTATAGTLSSKELLTLADQNPSPTNPPTPPCSISQMTIPPTPTTAIPPGCGHPSPSPPLSLDPGTINLFFVNNLVPPAAGGTLYGFSLIGNNGVAIGGHTFFAPTPLQARPDTIAHELLHNLGLSHGTFGAGPYNPVNATTNPFGGIAPPVLTANPFLGECDPNYPGCGANLMTSGDLRTGPTLRCVLAPALSPTVMPPQGCLSTINGQTVQSPGLYTGMADQVTSVPMEDARQTQPPTTPELPTSQQRAVLAGGNGLLDCVTLTNCSPIQQSGLSQPIPYETMKAQLETGDSPTGRVTFDLSGPVDGKPGETLVRLVVSLPEGDAFAGQGGFDVVSQSRKDLVQDIAYYPGSERNPLRRSIAYNPGADNADIPPVGAAGASPCAATTATCVMVKFQGPGLGADDSFSFSQKVLSGGAPIAKDELCKAKITYMFSDGYTTTSNFSRCSPDSRPLIASSWRPDPHVAPHFTKSNLLLAQAPPPTLPCTPDPNNSTQCLFDPTQNPPEDADPTHEGGQLGQSCDGGLTTSNINVSGTIPGPNITVGPGRRCNYTNCQFLGSLTINGGNVFLGSCVVNGNLTMISGTLNLSRSAQVIGNTQIANGDSGSGLSNGFIIGPGAQVNNLTIQNLPPNEGGMVCGSMISGGMTVKNNQSSIEIGGAPNCTGNIITGGLNCKGNFTVSGGVAVSGGGNTVSGGGGSSGQCAPFVQ